MALPATGVYEVRATATPGNVNGGGFNSARGGTDYTLQDAAQLTRADGTAAGGVTFGSVLGGFTDAMKGNYLHITASTGLTVGWYEIVTVIDTNNVDLDRTPGTGSATTFYVGGAASLNSTLDDEFFETAVPGNKFWIRQAAGSVTLGEAVAITAAGGASQPIRIEGYTSTRGDAPTGSNRPTIICAASSFTIGANWDIYHVIFTTTSATGVSIATAGKLVNIKVTNSSTTAARSGIQSNAVDVWVFNCEAISYRGAAYATLGSSGTVEGCAFHSSNIGLSGTVSANVMGIYRNIIDSNVTAAIQFSGAKTGSITIGSNTLYGSVNTTGIGVDLVTGCTDIRIINTIIYGFVTGVAHADTQTVGFDDYNDYFNNDADVSAAGQWQKGSHDIAIDPAFTGAGQVTGTAGAFTAGNDRIVDTSKDFTALGVVAGNHIYIISGTGDVPGIYGITSIATTTNPNDTLIITPPPGTDTTADKTYQISTYAGNAFLPTGAL